MSSLTEHYEMAMPDAGDPVDINVLNANTRTIDGLIHNLATNSDRVTANAVSTVNQFQWRSRSWANGSVEIWGVRTFSLARAGFEDIEVTLPEGYALAAPYFLETTLTYLGPWTAELVNNNNFAKKFKSAAPKIYCMPYDMQANKFRLYVWNLTGEQTSLSVNMHIVGSNVSS